MNDNIAAKLYDQSTPESSKPEPVQSGIGTPASDLEKVPETNGELEFVQQFGDKLFQADINPHGTFQRNFAELRDTPGLAGREKEVAETFQETAKYFHGHGFNADEAAKFQTEVIQTIRRPPDAETFARWEKDAYESLRGKYPHDFEKRVDLAKRYVNTQPDLKRILHETGAGSNPTVVAMLVEKAWSLRSAGRLRQKKMKK